MIFDKQMHVFNGHRTVEHEENVVRIVNLFR